MRSPKRGGVGVQMRTRVFWTLNGHCWRMVTGTAPWTDDHWRTTGHGDFMMTFISKVHRPFFSLAHMHLTPEKFLHIDASSYGLQAFAGPLRPQHFHVRTHCIPPHIPSGPGEPGAPPGAQVAATPFTNDAPSFLGCVHGGLQPVVCSSLHVRMVNFPWLLWASSWNNHYYFFWILFYWFFYTAGSY